jgi:hypothetical protein
MNYFPVVLSGLAAFLFTYSSSDTQIDGKIEKTDQPGAIWGFDQLTFFDEFRSLSTVDLDDTRASCFNWYVHNAWPNSTAANGSPWPKAAPTLRGDLSISKSGLTIGTDRSGFGEGVATAVASGNGFMGTKFSGGFYAEASFSFDPTLVDGQHSWPAFWAEPIEFLVYGANRWVELDFIEQRPTPGSPTTLESVMWMAQWQVTSKMGKATGIPNFVAHLGSVDFTKQHKYGTLWVPSSLNNGTGLVQRYFDGQRLPDLDISYRFDGTFSVLDSQHMIIFLGAGPNWPINVRYVKVWQRFVDGLHSRHCRHHESEDGEARPGYGKPE